MATIEPGTVSAGTLRSFDLVSAFEAELARIAPEAFAQAELLKRDNFMPPGARESDEHPFWETEDAEYYVGILGDTLDALAPEGMYFGSHFGDGADFGFWESE